MKIREVYYSTKFEAQFRVLPLKIKKRAAKAEAFFRDNPFHPSLRLHKLEGKLKDVWSISLDRRYRIIFKPKEPGAVLFHSIGLHAIYEH